MHERIADMGIQPTTVPNTAMMLSGGLRDTSRKPLDIRPVGLHHIDVVDRERPIDKEKVAELAASIQREGLLQPIGLRRTANSGHYRLIYGAHRLAAAKLIAENDPTQDAIAAVLFPEKMPDWACKMAELAENLFRKDLTPKQREAHTALLAGYQKKHGYVVNAKARGNKTRATDNSPNGSGYHLEKTVTEQVASILGISEKAVVNRVKNAAKLAERQGMVIDATKKTPEGLSGDQLIAIGEAAMVAADSDKKQAKKEGKNPRYVNPHEKLSDTKALARLDVTDTKPFIDWCRKRLAGKHKPMSLSMLRSYRQALDDLIVEWEAKSE